MTFKEQELHNAYDPYNREALYSLRLDILIVLCLAILLALFGALPKYAAVFWVFPFYFLLELVFNYSLALLGRIESKKQLYASRQVRIQSIAEEYSPSGHWGSVIPRLYPKQLNVSRSKLICLDDSGKRLRLRSVVSGKKWQALSDGIEAEPQKLRSVTYGKLTHIVISYDDKDELCFQLNHNF